MNKKNAVKFRSKSGNDFHAALKSNVQEYFTKNNISPFANATMVIKTIILLAFYIIPFVILISENPPFTVAILLWLLMGIAMAGIGMSVMHDANHGAYSQKPWVNKILGATLNLLGGAVFNWKLQHNILHHTYTNISGMDDDIDTKAGMRFTPHDELENKHKRQYWYAFGLYSLITLYWLLAKDYVQWKRYRDNGVNASPKSVYYRNLVQLTIMKLLYIGIFLALPVAVAHIPVWQILIGFVLMHMVAGIILSVVFQLAHTVEGTSHPIPDENGSIQNNWAVHQMETTMNFAPKSKLLSWYLGGLNFQVEHHLFPKICHVHYPEISKIVQQTAAEYHVPYLSHPTLGVAIQSHIRLLHQLGRLPSWNDVID